MSYLDEYYLSNILNEPPRTAMYEANVINDVREIKKQLDIDDVSACKKCANAMGSNKDGERIGEAIRKSLNIPNDTVRGTSSDTLRELFSDKPSKETTFKEKAAVSFSLSYNSLTILTVLFTLINLLINAMSIMRMAKVKTEMREINVRLGDIKHS